MDSVVEGGGSDSNWTTHFSTTEDPEIMALLYDNTPFSYELHHHNQEQEQQQQQHGESMELPLSMYLDISDHDYYAQDTKYSNDCNSTITGWSQGCGSNTVGAPMSSSSFHFGDEPLTLNPQYHNQHDIESYYLTEAVSSELTNGNPIPMELFTMEPDQNNNNGANFLNSPAAYLLKDSSFTETEAAKNDLGEDSGQKPASKRGHPDPEPKKTSKNATPKKKSKVIDRSMNQTNKYIYE